MKETVEFCKKCGFRTLHIEGECTYCTSTQELEDKLNKDEAERQMDIIRSKRKPK